jgi:hypothetical protein
MLGFAEYLEVLTQMLFNVFCFSFLVSSGVAVLFLVLDVGEPSHQF